MSSLCWWKSPRRCRLKLWDDVPAGAEQFAVLACHRCLFISASSRNGPHWSKKRSLPIQGFISQRSSFTAHAFHFHSFSLWQIKLQQHVLMPSLIVQTFWCPVQREDCFLHDLSGSALSAPPSCFCFFISSSSSSSSYRALLFHCHPRSWVMVTYRSKCCYRFALEP